MITEEAKEIENIGGDRGLGEETAEEWKWERKNTDGHLWLKYPFKAPGAPSTGLLYIRGSWWILSGCQHASSPIWELEPR
ncbi:hypothetical protein FOFC_12492 [Fusarium oxysporum]|nr:hypothetical protein FOFC_12492 [Fusarium oxysporum]